jgi:galactosylceramidase
METIFVLVLVCVLSLCLCCRAQPTYVVDASVGLGRQFDGIGGLSGGGVSYN